MTLLDLAQQHPLLTLAYLFLLIGTFTPMARNQHGETES